MRYSVPIFFLFASTLGAQTLENSGVISSGAHVQTGTFMLSYSVGQFSGHAFSGDDLLLTAGIQQPVIIALELNISMLLDGPFDASNGLMWDSLRTAGHIPLVEPFTAMGYLHHGIGGGEQLAPSMLLAPGATAPVDWVFVELRDATDASKVVSTRSGIVLRNGDVVSADGGQPLRISAVPGNYHVAVHHRNHLPVITMAPVALGGPNDAVDLTDGSVTLMGVQPQRPRGSVMTLWAGDVNNDRQVAYTGGSNDRDLVLQAIGGIVPTASTNGYLPADVNLDGVVRYTGQQNDRDPILITIGGVVPTTIKPAQVP